MTADEKIKELKKVLESLPPVFAGQKSLMEEGELNDGRKYQIQIIITTDDDEFFNDVDF